MDRRVIVITGPTASGKSALALALAERHRGTVINADAMQTYDAFPILTAQPSEAERSRVTVADDWTSSGVAIDAVLCHGSRHRLQAILATLADRPGPIVPLDAYPPGDRAIRLERLLVERVISVNTAAAGGNASLMTIG